MSTTIKPIHTAADHAAALSKIESLWNAEPGTRDGDTLEVLATLVEVYEREHTPILPPDPVQAILFRLEQQGSSRKAERLSAPPRRSAAKRKARAGRARSVRA